MPKTAVIVGIDEAGRGALAGPVVAGACVLTDEVATALFIKDSKQLTPEKRDAVYLWITGNCNYGFGISSAKVVDTLGILGATEKAMQQALEMLSEKIQPTYVIVDGRDRFWFDYPHSSIIKGDQKEPCISAASIIAKVTRDRMMVEYAKEFPQYHFDIHKGYGVADHYKALAKHGICEIHRRTFLKSLLSDVPAVVARGRTTKLRRPKKSGRSKAVLVSAR